MATNIKDYSTTQASNTSLNTINVGEGMLPSNLNNAIRALMKNTMYKSTRELFEQNYSWDPVDIKRRNEKLAKWALKRWQYLEK